MKIISREAFLKLPSGTLFRKFKPSYFEDLQMKVCNQNDGWIPDFVSIPTHCFTSPSGTDVDLESYGSFKFEYASCRDGLFDEDQLFAVYELSDINDLKNFINLAKPFSS